MYKDVIIKIGSVPIARLKHTWTTTNISTIKAEKAKRKNAIVVKRLLLCTRGYIW